MALKRIVLRDFVIVRQLELELDRAFTALTGETGAGKSILIDALQLVTGARADTTLIREGAARTEVSAEFDSSEAVEAYLAEAGFDRGDDLLLRRSVDTQGKSRAWINGSPATAQQLRALGEMLFDIHGQHAWQSLTRNAAVRALLDAYGGISTTAMAADWQAWRATVQALERARSQQDSLERERERLDWQIGELDKLAPRVGEWDDLQAQHTRLSHAQDLLDAAQTALHELDGDGTSALRALHLAQQRLQSRVSFEPDFQNPAEVLGSAVAQVEDVLHTLRAYLRHADPDPALLAQLDTRLAQWLALARRYRRDPEDLPAVLAQWRLERAALDAAADLDALQAAEAQAHGQFLGSARAVSEQRASTAQRLAQAITAAMQDLGMQGGRFEVQLETLAQAQQHGLEDVQFLVAGHAGTTPRPVAKVASGGELSRLALAIAVTTSQLGAAPTLIFDEVDAGVGGSVALTVGALMRQLGQHRQVLAVTHLAQVAACAQHHCVVAKHSTDQGTTSTVIPVNGDARIAEIARMLGGDPASRATLAHAQEMLWKSSS